VGSSRSSQRSSQLPCSGSTVVPDTKDLRGLRGGQGADGVPQASLRNGHGEGEGGLQVGKELGTAPFSSGFGKAQSRGQARRKGVDIWERRPEGRGRGGERAAAKHAQHYENFLPI